MRDLFMRTIGIARARTKISVATDIVDHRG